MAKEDGHSGGSVPPELLADEALGLLSPADAELVRKAAADFGPDARRLALLRSVVDALRAAGEDQPFAEISAEQHRRLVGLFPDHRPGMVESVLALARLVFDSAAAAPVLGFRSAAGNPRLLRYETDGASLDLACETRAGGLYRLTGVLTPGTSGHALVLRDGVECASAAMDADGSFSVDLAPGVYVLRLTFAGGGGMTAEGINLVPDAGRVL